MEKRNYFECPKYEGNYEVLKKIYAQLQKCVTLTAQIKAVLAAYRELKGMLNEATYDDRLAANVYKPNELSSIVSKQQDRRREYFRMQALLGLELIPRLREAVHLLSKQIREPAPEGTSLIPFWIPASVAIHVQLAFANCDTVDTLTRASAAAYEADLTEGKGEKCFARATALLGEFTHSEQFDGYDVGMVHHYHAKPFWTYPVAINLAMVEPEQDSASWSIWHAVETAVPELLKLEASLSKLRSWAPRSRPLSAQDRLEYLSLLEEFPQDLRERVLPALLLPLKASMEKLRADEGQGQAPRFLDLCNCTAAQGIVSQVQRMIDDVYSIGREHGTGEHYIAVQASFGGFLKHLHDC